MLQAPLLLQGKPDHCSQEEGAAGSLQAVGFRAAGNAMEKQRSANQQLPRGGGGLGVGDMSKVGEGHWEECGIWMVRGQGVLGAGGSITPIWESATPLLGQRNHSYSGL